MLTLMAVFTLDQFLLQNPSQLNMEIQRSPWLYKTIKLSGLLKSPLALGLALDLAHQ